MSSTMKPFTSLRAVAAPMPQSNIDTDQIYPAAGTWTPPHDRSIFVDDEAGYGPNAFAVWRWAATGEPKPDFVLNSSRYGGAKILITGDNFGCGSSREMAVWALHGIGIRSVIAPSFGEIFSNNCFKSGILPVRMPKSVVENLLIQAETAPEPIFTVDLEQNSVTAPDGQAFPFHVDQYRRRMILLGLDDMDAILQFETEINAFKVKYLRRQPWLA